MTLSSSSSSIATRRFLLLLDDAAEALWQDEAEPRTSSACEASPWAAPTFRRAGRTGCSSSDSTASRFELPAFEPPRETPFDVDAVWEGCAVLLRVAVDVDLPVLL